MGVRTVRSIAEAGYVPATAAETGDARNGATLNGTEFAATAANPVVTLELADLIQDDNGEIVLFNDSHLPAVALHTDVTPVSEGALTAHVTAAGEDVSGFRYVAFSNGVRLFFQDSLDLFIVSDNIA